MTITFPTDLTLRPATSDTPGTTLRGTTQGPFTTAALNRLKVAVGHWQGDEVA